MGGGAKGRYIIFLREGVGGGGVVYAALAVNTLFLLWKVWTQESFQKVEFDRPGERSPEQPLEKKYFKLFRLSPKSKT